MLLVSGLSFKYKLASSEDLSVLQNISFEVESERYTSIIGPSGCGKTTLLLCLAGLVDVKRGSIILNGISPDKARQQHKFGFVFQKPVFFEWMTVLDNVTLPAKISGLTNITDQAYKFLKRFGIEKFAKSYPHELSGGMLSRAALVRALIHEPQYLFLDEAFNYLDEALREEINIDIQNIWLDKNMSVVSITHSIEEAVFMSDYIMMMTPKPSSVIKSYQVPFQRPREPSIRHDSHFIELVDEIRHTLKCVRGKVKDARI
ncbi:MAG: NitT/TauT family transport system ATP-binding protein [Blastocatellia bacterium]